MAELTALLARIPDATLDSTNNPGFFAGTGWIELDDLKAWLGDRDVLMHLLEEPSVIDMWPPFLPDLPSAILQPQPFYGHHSLFDPSFDPNGDTIDFHRSGTSTPSSRYSCNRTKSWPTLPPQPYVFFTSKPGFYPGAFKVRSHSTDSMTPEEMDDASEAWDWQPSNTVWLNKDVSSEVYIPAEPFSVTINCKVVRIERVRGVPSEYPVPRVATAYIVDFRAILDRYRVKDGNVMTLDMIWKDKVSFFRTATRGMEPRRVTDKARAADERTIFASLGKFEEIRCQRAWQSCKGVFACDIIDPSLLLVQRYELDPHARDAVDSAQIIQRLNQGTVIRNKVICYVNMIKKMKCTGKDQQAELWRSLWRFPSSLKKRRRLSPAAEHTTSCAAVVRIHGQITLAHIFLPTSTKIYVYACFRGQSIDEVPQDSEAPTESCSRTIGFHLRPYFMDGKDSAAFEFAWDRIHDTFLAETGKKLSFKAWDSKGDCDTRSGLMLTMSNGNVSPVSRDQDPQGAANFQQLGVLTQYQRNRRTQPVIAWWKHKLNHKWILPGLLEWAKKLSTIGPIRISVSMRENASSGRQKPTMPWYPSRKHVDAHNQPENQGHEAELACAHGGGQGAGRKGKGRWPVNYCRAG
ncbi:hypothetical protein C8J57DRAFT_1230303 [Mycena rebaudengoi]|nr:hypothetical protein C8J57DRAFT_1230303 [Mycena rebaudengoi]